MSMLQTLMREHQQETETVRAEIAEAEDVMRGLKDRHDANVAYFKEVCDESIRASAELFEALATRERGRIERLKKSLARLGKGGLPEMPEIEAEARELPRLVKQERGVNGAIATILSGDKR